MTNKSKMERIERRVDEFYTVCEVIILRTLFFGWFVAEVSRFVAWMFR